MKLLSFILFVLVSSVTGQCPNCVLTSSGPCQQVDLTCYAYQPGGGCPAGTTECTTTAAPATTPATTTTTPTTTIPPTTPQPTTAPCGNCITKQELININSQSSWWGNCDPSQPAKANPGGASANDGFYCSDSYVATLNEMLCSLDYCNNITAKRMLIGQTAYESAYFTVFYQHADSGRGALHMLPTNQPENVQDISAVWPESNASGLYNSTGPVILTTPDFAWLSAGAWFLRTNSVIQGCGLNLFLQSFNETSRCIFGNTPDPGYSDRLYAYNCAVQFLLDPDAPTTTQPPATTPGPSTAPPPSLPPQTPPPTSSPSKCNCITKEELININNQSSWWGNCDSSQAPKSSPGGAESTDGFYCSDWYVYELNQMLCSVGYCYDINAKRSLIGQVTYETAYFTKFYQPLDGGRGALHILPPNQPLVVQHMQDLWPHSDALNQYSSRGAAMLSDASYAFLSAGAWFLRTNQVIPGCNLNLFTTDFNETSRCVFGNNPDPDYSNRLFAYETASAWLINSTPPPTKSFGYVAAWPGYWLVWGLVSLAICLV